MRHRMRIIPSRKTDPETSRKGERDVAMRANTQKHKLLKAYVGRRLIADEAEAIAQTGGRCPWKRCSELREMGYLELTGVERISEQSGSKQVESKLTAAGAKYLWDHP